jgi:hypothetical protein
MKYKKSTTPTIIKKQLSHMGWMLRDYRWDQFLTLKEAQDQCGLHFRTISRIERGESVTLVSLLRYMRFLGLEISDIMPSDEDLE